jgi:hypothetical protein
MEAKLKDYDRRASWTPQQNQFYEGGYVTSQDGRQQRPRPQNPELPERGVGQKPRAPEKMPKARALALASTLKRWLAIASIVSFGTFGGLVALHQVGTTATQPTQSSSTSSQTSSTSNSSSQNNSNFLNQQGGNNIGTSSSSSTAVSGTHTS